MTSTVNPIQQHLIRPLAVVAMLALVAGCGDNGQDSSSAEAPAERAVAEQSAPADSGSTTAAEPAADAGTSADTSSAEETAAAPAEATASDTAAGGQSHTVTARSTAYDPVVLKINPGDTVSWTNMSGHNVHFEKGNIPEGAEPWQSPLGDNVNRTFDKEGLYLYKCDPHFALGMVGALIVGTPDNVAQVEQNAQGMYKRALAKAMKEIE